MSSNFPAFSVPPRTELPTQIDEGARVLVVDDSPTIRKVVTAILERHGYDIRSASDGKVALELIRNAPPFDLVLVDFVMPNMNGYQFCRALRSDPELSAIPVVLMSARAAVIGDRFVEQTGAADALSKPFDARALVAVVGGVLSKRKQGGSRQRSLPDPDEMIDEALLNSDAWSSAALANRHTPAVTRFASQVAAAIAPQLRALRPHDLQQPHLVEGTIVDALDEATLAGLGRALDEIDLPRGNGIVLRGDIEHLPLAELLQLFQLRRQGGVLKVAHGHKTVSMALNNGFVDLVCATGFGEEFRVGRYLVRLRLLTKEQVEAEVLACGGKTVIGQWLVAQGLLDAETLEQVLALQTAELTYEVIRWSRGRFTLHDEPHWPEAAAAKLGLGLSELVLEGFRRVDEWRLMANTIDFDAVCQVDRVALGAVARKIGPAEQTVLDAIDGERTVREVMAATALASFDVIKILYRFLETRIVRRK